MKRTKRANILEEILIIVTGILFASIIIASISTTYEEPIYTQIGTPQKP